MKNILRNIIVCLSAATVVSCGFLKESPTTILSEAVAYSTPEALESEVEGCYLAMHHSYLWKGQMAEYFHTASGLMMYNATRKTDDYLDGLLFAKYSNDSNGNEEPWEAFWPGINRCNRLLDCLPDSPVDSDYKKEIEGEVRFIRAYLYFTLVRIWGDVPLRVHSPNNLNEAHAPRTAYYKVYRQIIEDLKFAEKNMRDKERQEAVNFEKSRPYNYAATAVKSLVYLTIGSMLNSPDDNFWDSSRDEELIAAGRDPRTPDFGPEIRTPEDAFRLAYDSAEDVIVNGPYKLEKDYRTLFRWTEHHDWFLDEGIFVLPSSPSSGMNNYNSLRMLPEYPEGSSNYVTTNNNWGRVRPSRFAIEYILLYSGAQPDPEVGICLHTTDPRWNASFLHNFNRQENHVITPIHTYPPYYEGMTAKDRDALISPSKAAKTYDMPYYRKYLDPSYDVTVGKAHMYLVRLAELYLISAEAAVHLGMKDEAVSRLNEIRARARDSYDKVAGAVAPDCPPAYDESEFDSDDDLLTAIFWERQIELSAEGHERFDVVRHGATWLKDHIAVPANIFLKQPRMQSYFNLYHNGGKEYPEDVQKLRKSLLSAFPATELRLNSTIDEQNDFYWQ